MLVRVPLENRTAYPWESPSSYSASHSGQRRSAILASRAVATRCWQPERPQHIVIMSNSGFGGIHPALIRDLESREH